MKMVIHYHRKTGRIGAWGDAESETSHLPDHDIIRIETDIVIDPRWHRIENGELTEIDASEFKEWNAPTEGEIAARLEMEALSMLIRDAMQRKGSDT